jgi:hypothetical protein
MISSSIRNRLAVCLLGMVLLAPAAAQTVLELPALRGEGGDVRGALAVPPGDSLRLERMPLGDGQAEIVNLELVRAPGGEAPLLVEHSATGVTTTRPTPPAHFTGRLAGDPQSSVFVSIDSVGGMRSIVRRGGEVFVSDMPAAAEAGAVGTARLSAPAVRSRRVNMLADAPAQPFTCGVDGEFIEQHHVPPSAALLANLQANDARASALGTAEALSPRRRADIIIETDYELFQRLGSSAAVHAYVTDLLGYISSQYESEIGVRLNVTQIHAYTNSADPWAADISWAAMRELQEWWSQASRANQPRHHVHLLSARDLHGGIAMLDTLGAKQNAYGVSSNIAGNFSASNPQVIWDSLVVAHEIGHAFGSTHTHNFDNPDFGSNQGGAIDCCNAEHPADSQCAVRNGGVGRTGELPGINSITGGVSGTGAGTIMSYCHTLAPGLANISFNFGTNHDRGVNAWRVASVMQSGAQTYLPVDGAAPTNHTLSVSRQGTGSGTVTSNPAGIACGSTCSASYATNTQVTLSAQAASGSTFTGWGGACSGTASICSVSMGSARSVVANFDKAVSGWRTVVLRKTGSGTGRVNSNVAYLYCDESCSKAWWYSVPAASALTLTAQAASGSVFAGWGGVCSGTGSCTIAAGGAEVDVTAHFSSGEGGANHTLSVSRQGAGSGMVTSSPAGITCGSTCSASYAADTQVTLTAQPTSDDSLSFFAGWRGACSGTAKTCSVSMDGAHSVVADFDKWRMVVFQKAGSGIGHINSDVGLDCNEGCRTLNSSVPAASALTLTAQAIRGSVFAGWSGMCTGTGSCTIAAGTGRVDVTALFNLQTGGGNACRMRTFNTAEERVLGAYIAYYGRPADAGGLAYWANRMSTEGGSIWSIIEPFGNSNEYRQRFGSLGNTDLINNLYQQMYGRRADPAGLSYYTGLLDAGRSTLASIAVNILDGTAGVDAIVLESRMKVARHYVTQMEAKGPSAPVISDVRLADLLSWVRADSVDAACMTLTDWIN